MNVQLIQGQFSAKDALDILTQMVHVKVKYHEHKINGTSSEEDIKRREAKIKSLQKDLFEARKNMLANGKQINIEAVIRIEEAKP